jgi:dephospho-CoA kinase
MSRQLDDTSRLQKADDIIENSDDIERLDEQIQALHRYYLSLPQTAVD